MSNSFRYNRQVGSTPIRQNPNQGELFPLGVDPPLIDQTPVFKDIFEEGYIFKYNSDREIVLYTTTDSLTFYTR